MRALFTAFFLAFCLSFTISNAQAKVCLITDPGCGGDAPLIFSPVQACPATHPNASQMTCSIAGQTSTKHSTLNCWTNCTGPTCSGSYPNATQPAACTGNKISKQDTVSTCWSNCACDTSVFKWRDAAGAATPGSTPCPDPKIPGSNKCDGLADSCVCPGSYTTCPNGPAAGATLCSDGGSSKYSACAPTCSGSYPLTTKPNCTGNKETQQSGSCWSNCACPSGYTTCTYGAAVGATVCDGKYSACNTAPEAPATCEEWAFNEFYKNGDATQKEYFKGMYFCPSTSTCRRGDQLLNGDGTLKSPLPTGTSTFANLTTYNFGPSVVSGKTGILPGNKKNSLCTSTAHPTITITGNTRNKIWNVEGMNVEFTGTPPSKGYIEYPNLSHTGTLNLYDLATVNDTEIKRSNTSAKAIIFLNSEIRGGNGWIINDLGSFYILKTEKRSGSMRFITTLNPGENPQYYSDAIKLTQDSLIIVEDRGVRPYEGGSAIILGKMVLDGSTLNVNSGTVWVPRLELTNCDACGNMSSTVNIANNYTGKITSFQASYFRHSGPGHVINITSSNASNTHFLITDGGNVGTGVSTFRLKATAGTVWLGTKNPTDAPSYGQCISQSTASTKTVTLTGKTWGTASTACPTMNPHVYYQWGYSE